MEGIEAAARLGLVRKAWDYLLGWLVFGVAPDKDETFEAVIDIHRARQRGVRPLNAREPRAFQAGNSVDAETAAPLAPERAPALREDPTRRRRSRRLRKTAWKCWRKQLLDLTGRNRLLNLLAGGGSELTIDCPAPQRLLRLLAETAGDKIQSFMHLRAWPAIMNNGDPRSARLYRERMHQEADRILALQALEQRENMAGRRRSRAL